jgi:hypothetical protein
MAASCRSCAMPRSGAMRAGRLSVVVGRAGEVVVGGLQDFGHQAPYVSALGRVEGAPAVAARADQAGQQELAQML